MWYLWNFLGAIPIIIASGLGISYFSRRTGYIANIDDSNIADDAKIFISNGTKIWLTIMFIISLLVVVGGSIYTFKWFYDNKGEITIPSIVAPVITPNTTLTHNYGKVDTSNEDIVKGYSKEEIIKYSIQILRESGKNDSEIKEELMSKFDIDSQTLDELFKVIETEK